MLQEYELLQSIHNLDERSLAKKTAFAEVVMGNNWDPAAYRDLYQVVKPRPFPVCCVVKLTRVGSAFAQD